MEPIITYNFNDNFVERLADHIFSNFYKNNPDLSRICCVFGGRRPALFLRRALAGRIKGVFLPPAIFSMDDFVWYCFKKIKNDLLLNNLDSSFLIYQLAKKYLPNVLKNSGSFADFLPWAQEIVSFIEQIDLENVSDISLGAVQASAAIGYEISENINALLSGIAGLRNAYHGRLAKDGKTSRGRMYADVGADIQNIDLCEFDKVLFCNFFYLHAAESRIIKGLLSSKKAVCFFQGSQSNWSVLAKTANSLGVTIECDDHPEGARNLALYEGFDVHSQAAFVRSILEREGVNKDNTLIVLPQAETLLPVLGAVSEVVEECNVSMGYPLSRNPLYVLFELLAQVNESAKGDDLYSADYLNLMRHPLIKNIRAGDLTHVTRVIIHKIEEFFSGSLESSLGGRIFASLKDIESQNDIYELSAAALSSMGIAVDARYCREHLKDIHRILLARWPCVNNFSGFSRRIKDIIALLSGQSAFLNFPFNVNVVEKILSLVDEFKECSFNEEPFDTAQMWEVFKRRLKSDVVPFKGSPLRGTQILGLFETRSLNFENVIVMDMNESVLPKLRISEPLIPREVMLNLGINRLEKEEEIQRYQFRRLIESARTVHLVYAVNDINEKSRFIEELLWERQKGQKKIDVINVVRGRFKAEARLKKFSVHKTPEILRYLKSQTYSASRINTYLFCPLQFYFQYVLGLRERDDLLESPQAKHIGTFIHELLEETFSSFLGKKPLLDPAFCSYFFQRMEEEFSKKVATRMRSDSILLKGIVEARLKKFLEYEQQRPVKRLICLEERKKGQMRINGEPVAFAYTVDRVDELQDESLVVIDYKTGGSNIAPKNLRSLEKMEFNRVSIKETIRSFQMPLYHYFMKKEYPGKNVNAVLYNIRDADEKNFIAAADIEHQGSVSRICFEALEFIFREIFDGSICFEPDKDEQRCRYCSFRALCG
jgi:ATP-dependent helicase/nuclease subunit B